MTNADEPLNRATLLGMCAMGLGVLVIANDFTALSVALPSIERDLNADVTTVQWVITGYALVFGVLIVTGGRLTDCPGWRWIFFLNLPIAAFAALVTWRVVPREKVDDANERIDYGGIVALSICLFALLLALDMGTDLGWTDPTILGFFAVSAVSMAAFALLERRMKDFGLVPPDVLGNHGFLAAGVAPLLMSAIFFSALLNLPQFMTKQLGYSAVEAGPDCCR